MHRSQSPGDVFGISANGMEWWWFDPQPKSDLRLMGVDDLTNREIRVIKGIAPDSQTFEMKLPIGTEHPDFSDDQLIFMAVGCLEKTQSSEEPSPIRALLVPSGSRVAREGRSLGSEGFR